MPLRPFTREQVYLLPPSLDEWLPADHPVRYVACVVESLSPAAWAALGITRAGERLGAPAYHPEALLAVWLAGFMTGVRSARALETACRDQISFRWLSGNQTPDHNTLWRFYQAHRSGMRQLLRTTVETALRAGLVELALVAVDGSKVAGNAARDQTLDQAAAERLLARVEAAIGELEAQNVAGEEPEPLRLPGELASAEALRERVRQALTALRAAAETGGPSRINVTDPEARLLPTRQGWVAGYNAQLAVSRVAAAPGAADAHERPAGGRLILAATVTAQPDDHGQLLPLIAALEADCGQAPQVVVADGGYHDGPTLSACQEQGQVVVLPEGQVLSSSAPYHKAQFAYDPASDTFTCPTGQPLTLRGLVRRSERPVARRYRGSGAVCRGCAAFGECTTDQRQGRSIEVGPHELALRQHRAWMASEEARALSRQRQGLVEPVFGMLKEQHGLRRFLLRGLANVQAEWMLGAAGLNLKTLARHWAAGRLSAPKPPDGTAGPTPAGRARSRRPRPWRWWPAARRSPRSHHRPCMVSF